MAIEESDREDLLREAVALVPRMEVQLHGQDEAVLLGKKRNGGLAIYFGADPVYQFDESGRLRRAYRDGHLYRTQGTTLARLTRERSETETTLTRVDLGQEELNQFLTRMISELNELRLDLCEGAYSSLNQRPEGTDSLPGFLQSLQSVIEAQPALAPVIPGKR